MFAHTKNKKYFKIVYLDPLGKKNVRYYEAFTQKDAERRLNTLSSFDRLLSVEKITKDEFLKHKTTKPYKSSNLWEVKYRDKDGIIHTRKFRANYKSTCKTNIRRVKGFKEIVSIKKIAQ